jgi:hypothetical protein
LTKTKNTCNICRWKPSNNNRCDDATTTTKPKTLHRNVNSSLC